MEQEVDRDEIVIVRRWGHVENKTMDAVLYEGPQEHAKQEDHGETVLMDQDGVIWGEYERKTEREREREREREKKT